MTATRPRPRRPLSRFERPWVRRWLVPALALIGVGAIALVWTQLGDDEPARDDAVEELIPAAGSQVLSQTAVGIDLVDDEPYVVALTINGTRVPDDQILFADSLNRATFNPSEGQAIENLQAEQNCVLAEYFPTIDGPGAVQTEFWCFNAS